MPPTTYRGTPAAGRPEPRLTEVAASFTPPTRLALDLGCGHGDNTRWLAERGYRGLGLDVSPTAISQARHKATDAGLTAAEFACESVLAPLPVAPASAGLAIDRGCFHVLGAADRPSYVHHVAEALAPGGWWLFLCGNADEPRAEGEEGPPQLTADEVVRPLIECFELHRMERCRFTGSDGQPTHLAWRALLQRRAEAPYSLR